MFIRDRAQRAISGGYAGKGNPLGVQARSMDGRFVLIKWKQNIIITMTIAPIVFAVNDVSAGHYEAWFTILIGLAWCTLVDWFLRGR